jgi:hypothetical protein
VPDALISLTVVEVIEDGSIGSLNVTVGSTAMETPIAPLFGVVLATVGATPAWTVRRPVPVPKTWSGLSTSMLPAPTVAVAPTVMLAVIWVQLFTMTELTVMPVAEKTTVAPFWKFVPVIVSASARPCSAADGAASVTTGRGQPEISLEYVVLSFADVSYALHAEVVGRAIGEVVDRRGGDVPDVHRLRVVPRARPVVDAVAGEVRRGDRIHAIETVPASVCDAAAVQERREEDQCESGKRAHGFEVSAAVSSQDRATWRQDRSRNSNREKA